MAIGTVTKFNDFEKNILQDAQRQWDDSTAGNIQFILATNSYTFSATDSTTTDLSGVIIAGDGAPIAATSLAIDEITTPGTTYLDSGAADFGSAVTITAKWLFCTIPVTADTYSNTTNKLLWAVDLDDTNGTASKTSTASDFTITPPTNGWISFT